MLQSLSVRSRLYLIVAVVVVGFAGFAAVSGRTMRQTGIGGPLYGTLVANKDLTADVLPPPEYIIEAYLVTLQMANDPPPAALEKLVARARTLRQEFEARHELWTKSDLPPAIAAKLGRDAYGPAMTFFRLRDEQFIPAVQRGDHAGAAEVLRKSMEPAYEEHRKAIDDLVALLNARTSEVEKGADEVVKSSTALLWGLGLGILALVFVSVSLVARTIVGPLATFVERMRDIAEGEGDLTRRIPAAGRDELGDAARAFNSLIERIQKTVVEIAGTAHTVASSAEEFTAVSRQIASSAHSANQETAAVNTAIQGIHGDAETVASASEEMTASIQQIARNTSEAEQFAASAVALVESTNGIVARLGESSNEIENVVKVITSIAEQTNLLALNATIEAARAGEAGKGFSVVAGEVKELAKQSARASEDIEHKIRGIQTSSKEAVEAIGRIGTTISRISEVQTSIAAAVEQQAATSTEIGRSISSVARSSNDIREAIERVAASAQATSSGTTQTESAAEELSRTASALESLVGSFRYEDAPATNGRALASGARRPGLPPRRPNQGSGGQRPAA